MQLQALPFLILQEDEMNKNIIKDIVIRALKTFVQAFLSAISVDALLGVTDLDTLKRIGISMLIAGTAAGLSAVWNAALEITGSSGGAAA